MKTKVTKTSSLLFLLGVIILCNTLTLCNAQNLFTGKMRYTYYKKVKVNSHKDTLSVASTKKHKKGNVKASDPVYMPVKNQNEVSPIASLASSQPVERTSANANTSKCKIINEQNVMNVSEPKETTNNKVKRIYNEKANRFFGSKGNTMEYKNVSCNILLKVLIVIAVIVIIYIVIVCLLFLLLEVSGGFAIGC